MVGAHQGLNSLQRYANIATVFLIHPLPTCFRFDGNVADDYESLQTTESRKLYFGIFQITWQQKVIDSFSRKETNHNLRCRHVVTPVAIHKSTTRLPSK